MVDPFYLKEWKMYWYERRSKKKRQKNDSQKGFKLINNAVLEKTMENVGKHKNIKLVTTEVGKIYLVSETNYHTKSLKCYTGNILAKNT